MHNALLVAEYDRCAAEALDSAARVASAPVRRLLLDHAAVCAHRSEVERRAGGLEPQTLLGS